MTGTHSVSALGHLVDGWPSCQFGAWAVRAWTIGRLAILGSCCIRLVAGSWPALSVQSGVCSVIQRSHVQIASVLAASRVLDWGKVNWCGPIQAIGFCRICGVGANELSNPTSLRPVKFQEPPIHMASLPPTYASRGLPPSGGETLSRLKNEPNRSAASTASGWVRAEDLRSSLNTLPPFCHSRLKKPQAKPA